MDFNNLKYMCRHPEKIQILNSGAITTFNRLHIQLPDYLIDTMEPKQCFKNAAKVAEYLNIATDFNVKYVEGFTTVFQEIPIVHAFVLIDIDGVEWILDPTMEFALEKSEDDIFNEEYAMVDIWDGSEISQLALEHQCWGPWSKEL